jgi:transposase
LCRHRYTWQERFFEGKATEHLIGPGIRPEHLNDDRLGRVLDQLYLVGLTRLFVSIALKAAAQFGVATNTLHLDSSSFHVHGEYEPDALGLSVVVEKTASVDGELQQENVAKPISAELVLLGYKRQQSPERGFRFLKDPLFFTNSVFVKSPERVEALAKRLRRSFAFVMGLCLLVYSLGQRALRSCLVKAGETLKNQLGQPTQRPTLRPCVSVFPGCTFTPCCWS